MKHAFSGISCARRSLAALIGFLVALLPLAAVAQTNELRIYNWSDYIDEQILKDFEKETGIKVVYDVFDTNELLETKLMAGKSGYDIVVPTASFLARQIKAGIFQKLDKSKLPNLKNVWPEIADKLKAYDPDNAYSVTYMWGTTGIGYNAQKIKERMPNAPLDSWKLVYDPEIVKTFKDCGVHVLNSPEDLLPSVLRYLGLDPNSKKAEDYEKAAAHLLKLRPYIAKFHSDEYKTGLVNGDVCLVVGYSGDVKQSAKRAKEANNGIEIVYAIPKEGAQLWFDQMAIPKDAPNPEAAHKFIDYMLRPDVIAKASNFTAYANANLPAQKLVDEKVLKDPGVYPPPEVLARLFPVTPVDARLQRTITRLWTKVTTGQ